MRTFHQETDLGMSDVREVCWPDSMGQSLTRRTLHWECERADQPYHWAAQSISTAFVCKLKKLFGVSPSVLKLQVLAARERCGLV